MGSYVPLRTKEYKDQSRRETRISVIIREITTLISHALDGRENNHFLGLKILVKKVFINNSALGLRKRNCFHQEIIYTEFFTTLCELGLNTINNLKHHKQPSKPKTTLIVLFLASTNFISSFGEQVCALSWE